MATHLVIPPKGKKGSNPLVTTLPVKKENRNWPFNTPYVKLRYLLSGVFVAYEVLRFI